MHDSDDLSRWRSLGVGQVVRLSFNGERIKQPTVVLSGSKGAIYDFSRKNQNRHLFSIGCGSSVRKV
ncbi:MAG: DUF3999 domain-containing protein [Candidatus Thiodiazotropha sp. (ex Lucinoma aequizonata)]|nr:DUF3999 domain-containing protein [Candidatus Thiodiazotropha sp. (ex Lucinoma aequizonata)]MCU7887058.1 DUF3999 domain-containing protein [Candidatus Thiodiazotropha sp. (ex Lucinoma aequizonata)]MCU7894083.1 DUF3999 domain-containing protein [Candidatus Thiodiazotropha sp. (ex Lucinoma aequizonata)]MCU7898758.1 DUF3999 domain-containing protein [Candidatus Thiodiazotropha sp. (ex Lucinoma aequizonata)]MCU7900809.1 DUF3999 domain-containing protein [Candidatus Thiodiazotropha sp. (ex Lucino